MTYPSPSPKPHVLIIGAGITGLYLAQALTKLSVPFTIFERADCTTRTQGWGLVLHWILSTFDDYLPASMAGRLLEACIDPRAARENRAARFPAFDLRTGELKFEVPSKERVRVSRAKLVALLGEGIDVQWNKALASIGSTSDSVTAHFTDGTSATGSLLVGCDGSRSFVRQFMCPSAYRNNALPVRGLGFTTTFTGSQIAEIRKCDSQCLQALDSKTHAFFFFCVLDMPPPDKDVETGQGLHECQIWFSWPFRADFAGHDQPLEVPDSDIERVRLMKRIAEDWADPFRGVIMSLLDTVNARPIKLEDWVPDWTRWNNDGGKLALIGDAAHQMTMFRSDAANHGLRDVGQLVDCFTPVWNPSHGSGVDAEAACERYEREMVARTREAVLASRKACLDAHGYGTVDGESPLMSERVAKQGMVALN